MEVCLLSQWDIRPYPVHYKPTFAFSILLYLHHIVVTLRQPYHAKAWNGSGFPRST